jgi:hypothetical protein
MINRIKIQNIVNSETHNTYSITNLIIKGVLLLLMIFVIGQSNSASAQSVKQSKSELSTTAKHYKFTYIISKTQIKDIEYILVLSSKGEVKSCFNACDVCYTAHKGYSQSGTKLRCNNCGKVFEIDSLGSQGSGGCWPGHLVHSLEGSNVVINESELIKGEYYFLAKTTGIEENTTNLFTIINKNNNEIIVKLADSSPKNFKIYATDGRICRNISSISQEFNVDISDLPSGSYFLVTEQGDSTVSEKFNILR